MRSELIHSAIVGQLLSEATNRSFGSEATVWSKDDGGEKG
jgi:hypothetical protein